MTEIEIRDEIIDRLLILIEQYAISLNHQAAWGIYEEALDYVEKSKNIKKTTRKLLNIVDTTR